MENNEDKIQLFLKEYGELREKHRLDFISVPQFVPNDKGIWELRIVPQVVSTENEPVKSPFIV